MELSVVSGLDELGSARAEKVRQFVAQHPQTNLEHDERWLKARAKAYAGEVRQYVMWNDDGAVALYAPFFLHPSHLSIDVLRRTILSVAAKRLTLNAGPLLSTTTVNQESLVQELLEAVADGLQPREYGFVLASLCGTPFESGAFKHQGQTARTVAIGQPSERRLASVPASLEAYLGTLNSGARQDLRRHERKLLKHVDNDLRVRVFSQVEEVDEFLQTVAGISEKTYQSAIFHAGVERNQATHALLREAAAHGFLRGYVMYCANQAVAFMVGNVYRGTYYSDSIGYLPSWKEWGVGNTLHMHVIDDLAKRGDVNWFDFMYSDNANKARLSTLARSERNIAFFTKRGWWGAFGAAFVGTQTLSTAVLTFIEKHGLKERLQAFVHTRAH